MTDAMFTCKRCGETKPIAERSKGTSRRMCKACWTAEVKAYRLANYEKVTAKERERYWKNVEKRRAATAKVYKEHPERWAHYSRLKKFGLTSEQYAAMQAAQNMKCAICETELVDGVRNGCNVDHDHDTNRVRALLCNKCNRVLGYVQDDQYYLMRLAAYLVQHQDRLRVVV